MRLAMFLCVSGLALGCAHSHDKFFLPDGTLCAEVISTVLGTGEIEKYVLNPCIELIYDTKDTGISDNVTKLGGKVAEGLARGAVKGLIPVP